MGMLAVLGREYRAAWDWCRARFDDWTGASRPAPLAPEEETQRALDAEEAEAMMRAARAALANPALNEAFDTLRRTYIAAWSATQSHQTAERERLWGAVAIVDAVRSHLHAAAMRGVLTEGEVSDLRRRSVTAAHAEDRRKR